MKTVDFYFDYLSPFAYLASMTLPAVCERRGAELRLRPILFAGLLNHWGQRGPAEIPPKALYAFRTCLRHARQHGIPFRAPMFHPFNPLTALRATLAVDSPPDQVRAMDALYELGWARGGDLGDPEAIRAALTAAGLDGSALIERARAADIKSRLKAETDAALARGVFGIPTMIVDDEIFWGLDQIPYLELFLDGRDPLAGVDISTLLPRGIGAWRPAAR
jgi:2-hydroxychromene-2-carboxylate isomerase